MERLTERYGDGYIAIKGCATAYEGIERKGTPASNAIVRLAAYEDTGLEPEEVTELVRPKTVEIARLLEKMCEEGSAQHMLELFQAEKDGRLAVLPCKVGDTLYYTLSGRIIETKVRTFFIGHPSHNIENRNLRMIRTDRFDVNMDKLGKTVFLTSKEAEAALEKRGGR